MGSPLGQGPQIIILLSTLAHIKHDKCLQNECLSEWITKWINEWMNEWGRTIRLIALTIMADNMDTSQVSETVVERCLSH